MAYPYFKFPSTYWRGDCHSSQRVADSMGAHLWDVLKVHARGCRSFSTRVLQVTTEKAANTEILAHMERGTRSKIAATGSVPCITNLEDSARPCWAQPNIIEF